MIIFCKAKDKKNCVEILYSSVPHKGHGLGILKLIYACMTFEQISEYIVGHDSWVFHYQRKKIKIREMGRVK